MDVCHHGSAHNWQIIWHISRICWDVRSFCPRIHDRTSFSHCKWLFEKRLAVGLISFAHTSWNMGFIPGKVWGFSIRRGQEKNHTLFTLKWQLGQTACIPQPSKTTQQQHHRLVSSTDSLKNKIVNGCSIYCDLAYKTDCLLYFLKAEWLSCVSWEFSHILFHKKKKKKWEDPFHSSGILGTFC